jgi:hypothetical protein
MQFVVENASRATNTRQQQRCKSSQAKLLPIFLRE